MSQKGLPLLIGATAVAVPVLASLGAWIGLSFLGALGVVLLLSGVGIVILASVTMLADLRYSRLNAAEGITLGFFGLFGLGVSWASIQMGAFEVLKELLQLIS